MIIKEVAKKRALCEENNFYSNEFELPCYEVYIDDNIYMVKSVNIYRHDGRLNIKRNDGRRSELDENYDYWFLFENETDAIQEVESKNSELKKLEEKIKSDPVGFMYNYIQEICDHSYYDIVGNYSDWRVSSILKSIYNK